MGNLFPEFTSRSLTPHEDCSDQFSMTTICGLSQRGRGRLVRNCLLKRWDLTFVLGVGNGWASCATSDAVLKKVESVCLQIWEKNTLKKEEDKKTTTQRMYKWSSSINKCLSLSRVKDYTSCCRQMLSVLIWLRRRHLYTLCFLCIVSLSVNKRSFSLPVIFFFQLHFTEMKHFSSLVSPPQTVCCHLLIVWALYEHRVKLEDFVFILPGLGCFHTLFTVHVFLYYCSCLYIYYLYTFEWLT